MSEVILSDYFYGDESEQFIYFRIPRLLITSPRFKHLSTDAKLLYGMLLDRMSLSAKNNWYDEDGRVYIYYTVEEICGDMNCGRDKAMKLLAELDTGKGVGLIERIKQGQGKPTKIYVKRFTTRAVPPPASPEPDSFMPIPEVDFFDVQKSEKPTSRGRKSRLAEVEKSDPNHTNRSHPDFSHPDPSISPRYPPYRELKKSIELNGVKDPVLTRINPDGGLEILSGQRRHMIARELNYPVPAIIQKIDDADAKILVSDGNLHRPKISTYDLSRTLRMKMEGMKQKAGRRKKGFTAEELNSDEKLAKEMGMSVSKLNRIIRLSEASKEVCNRVDDGTLPLSAASALSFLKPENQDVALHLTDLGYKLPTERIEYLKKVEKAGKLDEMTMRKVLDGENVLEPPKVVSFPGTETPQPTKAAPPSNVPTHEIIPPAPTPGPEPSKEKTPVEPAGVPAAPEPVATTPTTTPPTTTPPAAPTPTTTPTPPEKPAQEKDPFKGEQERPEYTKVILAGDRLRRYFPVVNMTPRQIEESVYEALEERRQRLEKQKQKEAILKKGGPTR